MITNDDDRIIFREYNCYVDKHFFPSLIAVYSTWLNSTRQLGFEVDKMHLMLRR